MKNNTYSELDEALSLYSDLFKDANGFRPRGMVQGWTLADFDAAIADLSDALAEERKSDEERLADSVGERDWLTLS